MSYGNVDYKNGLQELYGDRMSLWLQGGGIVPAKGRLQEPRSGGCMAARGSCRGRGLAFTPPWRWRACRRILNMNRTISVEFGLRGSGRGSPFLRLFLLFATLWCCSSLLTYFERWLVQAVWKLHSRK